MNKCQLNPDSKDMSIYQRWTNIELMQQCQLILSQDLFNNNKLLHKSSVYIYILNNILLLVKEVYVFKAHNIGPTSYLHGRGNTFTC